MQRLAFVSILLGLRVAAAQPAEPPPPPTSEPAPAPGTPTAPTPPVAPTPGPPALAPAAPVVAPSPPPASPDVASEADQEAVADYEPWTMRFGGFVQPQFRMRQNSPAAFDEDGFRMARARITATGAGKAGNLDLGSYFEAELQPTFTLYDAYFTVSRALPQRGVITLDVGQTRVPISRQQLISDTRRSFVDAAQLATIAPDRDLGAKLTLQPPAKKRWLGWIRVIGGVFNGEGRNQVQNINERYFYAGRLEITPIGGGPQPYAESAFAGKWLSAAMSVGYNTLSPGAFEETQLYLGADISGAWRGLSGSYEILQVRHNYTGDPTKYPGPAYHANGWVAQAAYLLPYRLPPLHQARLELAARVEEIDRNDAVPIIQAGDPNQTERMYTGVATLYLRQHLMKVALAATHFHDVEQHTATGINATYPHDQILLQVTYRVE